MNKLLAVQSALKAPKNQLNKFGGYNYRSCEDILEALKPLLKEHGCTLWIDDEMVSVGNRVYVKATATFIDGDMKTVAHGWAREEEVKKGMDSSQITGAASSYARKYALNGLFLIDDSKDSDHTNNHEEKPASKPAQSPATQSEAQTSITKIKAVTPTKSPKFFTLETEDGGKYGCSAELADIAQDQIGNKIALVWRSDGRFKNAVEIQEIQEEMPF